MTYLRGFFINYERFQGIMSRGDAVNLPISTTQVFRGDSLSLRIQVLDEFQQPQDITDALIRFTMKYEEYCDEAFYSLRSDQGQEITILNAKQGLFDINIPYTATETWDIGWPYWFDVEITVGNKRQTIVKSRIEVLPDISNS